MPIVQVFPTRFRQGTWFAQRARCGSSTSEEQLWGIPWQLWGMSSIVSAQRLHTIQMYANVKNAALSGEPDQLQRIVARSAPPRFFSTVPLGGSFWNPKASTVSGKTKWNTIAWMPCKNSCTKERLLWIPPASARLQSWLQPASWCGLLKSCRVYVSTRSSRCPPNSPMRSQVEEKVGQWAFTTNRKTTLLVIGWILKHNSNIANLGPRSTPTWSLAHVHPQIGIAWRKKILAP